MDEKRLNEEGWERYPAAYVIGQNLLTVALFGLGAYAMSGLRIAGLPLPAVAYFAAMMLMLYVVLRRLVCTHCFYYGKVCSLGWGKLAACLFRQREGEASKGAFTAAFVTWMGGMLVPLGAIVAGLVRGFSVRLLVVLGAYLVLAVANLAWHKKSCEHCRNRYVCPGSAARS